MFKKKSKDNSAPPSPSIDISFNTPISDKTAPRITAPNPAPTPAPAPNTDKYNNVLLSRTPPIDTDILSKTNDDDPLRSTSTNKSHRDTIVKRISKLSYRRRASSKINSDNIEEIPQGPENERPSVPNPVSPALPTVPLFEEEETNSLSAKGTKDPSNIHISLENGISAQVAELVNQKTMQLQEKLADKEKDMANLERQFSLALNRIFQLKEKLVNDEKLKDENDVLLEKIEQMEKAKIMLQKSFEKFDNVAPNPLKDSEIQLSQEVVRMRSDSKRLQKERSNIYHEMQELTSANVDLPIRNSEIIIAESQQRYLDKVVELETLENAAIEKEVYYSNLQVKLNAEKAFHMQNVKIQNERAEQQAALVNELKTKLDDCEKECDNLKTQNEIDLKAANLKAISLKNQLADAENEKSALKAKMEQAVKEFDEKLASSENNDNSLKQREYDLKLANDELLSLKNQLAAVEKEKENQVGLQVAHQEIAALETKLKSLVKENADLKTDNKNISAKSSFDLSSVMVSQIQREEEISRLKENLETLKRENEKLVQSISATDINLQRTTDQYQKDNRLLGHKIENLENVIEGFEEFKKRELSLIQEKSVLEYNLNSLRSQSNLLRRELEHSNSTLSKLLLDAEAEVENLKETVTKLNGNIATDVTQNAHADGLCTKGDDEIMNFVGSVGARLQALMVEKSICTAKLEHSNSEKEKMGNEIISMKAQIIEQSTKAETLKKENIQLKEELFSCKSNYKAEIESLEKHVKGLGGEVSTLAYTEARRGFSLENSLSLTQPRNSITSTASYTVAPNLLIQPQNSSADFNFLRSRENSGLDMTTSLSSNPNLLQPSNSTTSLDSFLGLNRVPQPYNSKTDLDSGSTKENSRLDMHSSQTVSSFRGPSQPANSAASSIMQSRENSYDSGLHIAGPKNSYFDLDMSPTNERFKGSFSDLIKDLLTLVKHEKQATELTVSLEGKLLSMQHYLNNQDLLVKAQERSMYDLNLKDLRSEKNMKKLKEEVDKLKNSLDLEQFRLKRVQKEKDVKSDEHFLVVQELSLQKFENVKPDHAHDAISVAQKLGEELISKEKSIHNGTMEEKSVGFMKAKTRDADLHNERATRKEIVPSTYESYKKFNVKDMEWDLTAVLGDLKYLFGKGEAATLLVEKLYICYYRICFHLTIISMISIALPMTLNLISGHEMPVMWKIYTQIFAAVLAGVIVIRPKK